MEDSKNTNSKIKSNIDVLKEILRICLTAPKKDKRAFLFVVALFVISAGFAASIPVLSAKVLSSLQDSISASVITGILISWTVMYVLLEKFSDWFSDAGETFTEVVFRRYNTFFCQEKTRAFLNMPPLLLSSDFRQKAVSLIPRIAQVGENMVYNLSYFVYPTFRLASSLALLVGLLPVWSAVICALSVCYCILNLWINKKLEKTMDAVLDAETTNAAEREDVLENAGNIRMLGIEKEVLSELQKKYEAFHLSNQQYSIKSILFSLIPMTLSIISYLIIVFVGVYLAFEQKDVGTYVLLTGLGFQVLGGMSNLSSRFKWLHMHGLSYINLNKDMTYDDALQPKFGKKNLDTLKEIVLDKVCFGYPEEIHPVLENLNLKIKAGSRVAIIGNSGMGKSSLINVMRHAYEIQSGHVLYNGKDIRTISKESLRNSLTYIDQHPTFWSQKSIKENLLMFNPNATDADLKRVLQMSNLWDELIKKTKGLDSKVTAMSAGQKQRLSLARALLRHTQIIIMDEPTANLDTHAQTKVLEGIKNLSNVKGRKPTVIFASNVPAEIASANRILLLENGRIVEDGDPRKLMNDVSSKTYKRLKKYKALFAD